MTAAETEPQVGDSNVSFDTGSIAAGAEDEPGPMERALATGSGAAMALAIREERDLAQPPAASLPSAREWQATLAVAREIASTPFVPESYRGRPEAVVAAILTGRELGIGPMQSLRDIHMIDGRATFSANLLLAQLRRGGVTILASEQTDERAWIRARRSDTGEEIEVEWTYAEAQAIRRKGKALTDGDNWKNYRGDMLWARAVGRLARRLGPDLLGGMVYTREEMEDLDSFDTGGGYEDPAAQPVTWETLDPGARMHPSAPRNWKEIGLTLSALDSTRDWKALVAEILDAQHGVTRVADLTEEQNVQAGTRMANLAGYLAEVIMEGKEFPPPTSAEISGSVAWAFEGLSLDVTDPEPLQGEEVDAGTDAALTAEEAAAMAEAEDAQIEFGETTDGDE